ncbi:MAG: 30S ribosomal protein S8 [Anaerolinea sp.]|nr:30S ribosomal protein S8 [Anaerolinea sp.]MCC6972678.1 30S ribosomal protein S8 [Anaerolineae bacterium]CAG0966311.1 30S ribosomal protein S8 [Anaerolineae bacterium]
MISDPIADMFTRIRNALQVKQNQVEMPSSKLKIAIAGILQREGYIEGFSVNEDAKPTLTIDLKYAGQRRQRRPVITNIQRVSSPGRRVYKGKSEIPWVLSGMGIVIVTTPKGLMTGDEARRAGVGGEVIGYVW